MGRFTALSYVSEAGYLAREIDDDIALKGLNRVLIWVFRVPVFAYALILYVVAGLSMGLIALGRRALARLGSRAR